MVAPLDREQLLATVARSPQAFTVHDRDGWVGVFTADARVEDPVGSQPHVGYEQIYRFYDTFIGPRDIPSRSRHRVRHGRAVRPRARGGDGFGRDDVHSRVPALRPPRS